MKKFSVEIKWGVIFSLVMLAWMYFERIMGWHSEKIDTHALLTNLFAFPAILLYVLALLDKRKHYYSDKMNWLQGFFCGIRVAIVVAILSPLSQYLTANYISPEYFPNAIDHAVAIEEMTHHQAERYFTLGNYILQSALGAVALGTATAAIVAIFVRKK